MSVSNIKILALSMVIYLLLGINAFSQTPSIEVLNSKDDVLYVGVDNYIVMPSSWDTLLVTTTNGQIFPQDTLFNIIPARSGRATISVYHLKNNFADTVCLLTRSLLVYSLPPAKLKIGDRVVSNQSKLERDYLKENNRFSIHLNDDIIQPSEWMVVERITIGYVKGGYFIRVNCEGDALDEKALAELEKISTGQEISFQVKVKCEGNMRKTIPVYRAKLY